MNSSDKFNPYSSPKETASATERGVRSTDLNQKLDRWSTYSSRFAMVLMTFGIWFNLSSGFGMITQSRMLEFAMRIIIGTALLVFLVGPLVSFFKGRQNP